MENWQLDELNEVYEYQVLPGLLAMAVEKMSVAEINGLIRQYQNNETMLNILLDELPNAIEREKLIAHTATAELTEKLMN
jgi:hypothetical protein